MNFGRSRPLALAGLLALAFPPRAGLCGHLANPKGRATVAEIDAIRGRVLETRVNDPALALALLDQLRRLDPKAYAANAFDHLAATLAERVGDGDGAERALRRAGQAPGSALGDRAVLRLAHRLDGTRPHEALRLVAGFDRRFPGSAVARDARLLEIDLRDRTGDAAGAERLVRKLKGPLRREAEALCFERARASRPRREVREQALKLLRFGHGDAAAFTAASWLMADGSERLDPGDRWALGNALFVHRRFGRAVVELDQVARTATSPASRSEALFLLGRAAFKAGDDAEAGRAFAALAQSGGTTWRERALYQLARIALACGDEARSIVALQDVVAGTPPVSEYAADALVKLVRIHTGRREMSEARHNAAELRGRLGAGSRWAVSGTIEVAGALLAEGDAVAALGELDAVRPADADAAREHAYWRGAVLGALGRDSEAMASLAVAARGEDLLGRLARRRIALLPEVARAPVTDLVDQARTALAAGDAGAARQLAEAALDRGASGETELAAVTLLADAYRALPTHAWAFALRLPAAPGARLAAAPSWGKHQRASHLEAAEILRFLGDDAAAAEELRAAAPVVKDPAMLYQIAALASRAGDVRTSLVYADLLRRRLPPGFRRACLPAGIMALLYPDPYRDLVEGVARVRRVEGDLIRAVMREESRFDPRALSPAGAHGLMQFIPETARRVGLTIGLGAVEPDAIREPAVAISLGGAYLAELMRLFGGNEWVAVAAYNAGEEAAFAWLARAPGGEPDAFLREIEFSETRTYVDRVLTSLAAYRALRVGERAD